MSKFEQFNEAPPAEMNQEAIEQDYKGWSDEVEDAAKNIRGLLSQGRIGARSFSSHNWQRMFTDGARLSESYKASGDTNRAEEIVGKTEGLKAVLGEALELFEKNTPNEPQFGQPDSRLSYTTMAGVFELVGDAEKAAKYRKFAEESKKV